MQENDILGKFALVTADKANAVSFVMDGERDDCTGFMQWIAVWKGMHFSYDAMKEDCLVLNNFNVVMFSGNPAYFETMIDICKKLKKKVVTIFLPEGDVSQYDLYGINSYSETIYKAFNNVDVIFSMEEDKVKYYESIVSTPVQFVHVPLDERMARGDFRCANTQKTEHILVYGDNNPNNPVTVFGIARLLKKPLRVVCIPVQFIDSIKNTFEVYITGVYGKLGQYPFLRLLGRSWLHIYPTRWIGSSREPIACAVARTPCIGSNRSHTQRRLFPKLSCDIYDIDTMVSLANRLYTDLTFYDEVVDYAWENVYFYNLENTKKRFLEGCRKGRERW